jgi:hypothetical protein
MMTTTPATISLEDDLRALLDYDHQMRANERGQAFGCVTALGMLAVSQMLASWLEAPALGWIGAVGLIGGVAVAQVYYSRKRRLALPYDVLARVAASGDVRASDALVRFHYSALDENPVMETQDADRIIAVVCTYFSALQTMDGVLDSDAGKHWIRVVQQWGSGRTEVALAIIEACVRLNYADILPKLLVLSDREAPTGTMKQIRQAARDAIPLLSAHADFGSKVDIPAKLDELFRLLVVVNQNNSINLGERHLWLMHALTVQLPLLSKGDVVLEKKHRHRLHQFLRSGAAAVNNVMGRGEWEFRQAIVLCLSNLEDVEAIPAISAIARMEAPTDYQQETRALARKHLAKLEKIRDKLAVGGTLLRASEAPAAGQDELLRPAAPTEETQAELLLRPSHSE